MYAMLLGSAKVETAILNMRKFPSLPLTADVSVTVLNYYQ